MSLTDKIIEELRDDTYAGGLLDKDEVEECTDKFTRLTASADQPFGAQRMLAFAVVAEVLAVALVMFGMRYLLEVFGVAYVAVYGTIFVFFMGFFAAFAAYKIYKEYTPDRDVHVDDGVMSGFAEYGRSQNNLTIYIISAAAGIGNLGLFFALLIIKIG